MRSDPAAFLHSAVRRQGNKRREGDKLFLRALDERSDFFTLKLRYEGETLVESKFG